MKHTLKTHIEGVHEGLKKYKCGDCGKSISTKYLLAYHKENACKVLKALNDKKEHMEIEIKEELL